MTVSTLKLTLPSHPTVPALCCLALFQKREPSLAERLQGTTWIHRTVQCKGDGSIGLFCHSLLSLICKLGEALVALQQFLDNTISGLFESTLQILFGALQGGKEVLWLNNEGSGAD